MREKKGWDFLQVFLQFLSSVSIPLVIFFGGQYLNSQNNEKQQRLADDKTKQDRQLTDDKAKQDTLVKYLDQMADSLQHGLLKANPGDDRFIVAQSRTVLALQSLDRTRQHLVIQFLQAAGLNKVGEKTQRGEDGNIQLKKGDKVLLYQAQMADANLANSDLSGGILIGVNLSGANLGCFPSNSKDPSQCSHLSTADLSYADLNGANLSYAKLRITNFYGAQLNGANLIGADLLVAQLNLAELSRANLSRADLRDADLRGADLRDADLRDADLSRAILLTTDLREAKLDPKQLGGKKPPLLCHVALPEGFPDKDKLKDRDCDRIAAELLNHYPQRNEQQLTSLKDAQQYVDEERQKKWE